MKPSANHYAGTQAHITNDIRDKPERARSGRSSMTMSPFSSENIRGRILLVEDASVFREMQSLLLRRAGYAVTICDEPHLALLEASKQPFDVAVLNLDAPLIERPDFVATLRRHRPNIAIVYVALALTVEMTRALTSQGITAVLQRPVDPVVLIEKIDSAVGTTIRPNPSRLHADAMAESPSHSGGTASAPEKESPSPFSNGSASPFTSFRSSHPFNAELGSSTNRLVRSDSASSTSWWDSVYPFTSGPRQ